MTAEGVRGARAADRVVPAEQAARRARPVGHLLTRVVWPTQVVGAHHVPATGPVILAANHTGVVDGPVVFGASPRPLVMMIKQSMFTGPVGAFLRWSGQIPVDSAGDGGRSALAAAAAVLRRGGGVGIFPEGTRGRGDVADARGGVAWLALLTGAPVVPVAVLGTRRTGESTGHVPGLGRRLAVEMGEPVTFTRAPGVSGRQAQEDATAGVAAALAAVVTRAVARTGIALPEDTGRAPA